MFVMPNKRWHRVRPVDAETDPNGSKEFRPDLIDQQVCGFGHFIELVIPLNASPGSHPHAKG
jgi:hypothetical protein